MSISIVVQRISCDVPPVQSSLPVGETTVTMGGVGTKRCIRGYRSLLSGSIEYGASPIPSGGGHTVWFGPLQLSTPA